MIGFASLTPLSAELLDYMNYAAAAEENDSLELSESIVLEGVSSLGGSYDRYTASDGTVVREVLTYYGEMGKREINYISDPAGSIVSIVETRYDYTQPVTMGSVEIKSTVEQSFYLIRGELYGYRSPDGRFIEIDGYYQGLNESMYMLLTRLNLARSGHNGDTELYLTDPSPRLNGEHVKMLQRYLLFFGVSIGEDGIDGWFGRDTDRALRSWQKTFEMPETGRITLAKPAEPLLLSPAFFFTESNGLSAVADLETIELESGDDLVYSSYYGSIRISAEELAVRGFSSFIVSENKRYIASEKSGTVKVWDVLSGYGLEVSLTDDGIKARFGREFSNIGVKEILWRENSLIVVFNHSGRDSEVLESHMEISL